ncbi:MAG: phage portal protein family protein [Waterburya sp.]
MTDITLLPYQLAPSVDRADTRHVQELFYSAELPARSKLISAIERCPYNGIAIELKVLRSNISMGEYVHPSDKVFQTEFGRKTITEWVRANFEAMVGSISDVQEQMFLQAYPLGCAVAENVFKKVNGEAQLDRVIVLPADRYTFRGQEGEWDGIIYYPTFDSPLAIPRQKLLHIFVPRAKDPLDPWGYPTAARAYPYYEARRQASIKWNEKLARDAKGLMVVQGDSNETVAKRDSEGNILKNTNGSPKTEPYLDAIARKVKNYEDGDMWFLDHKIKTQHYAATSGMGADYNLARDSYAKDIFMAYGIPSTLLSEGSAALGQSGLNQGHRLIFDMTVERMVSKMRQEILDKIVKPLLVWNFGEKYAVDCGSFQVDRFVDPNQASIRTSTLMSAMLQGIIDPNDLEAVNRIREDCGLTGIDRTQWEEIQLQKAWMQQQEALAAQMYPEQQQQS